MKHYYIINHDTQHNRWEFDWDATQNAFGIATMLDTSTGDWLRTSPENASEHPDETRLTDQLSAIFAQLNSGDTAAASTDKWLLALHEVARIMAQNSPSANGQEISDGEAMDEVWIYLRDSLGINPDAYRADIQTAPLKIADASTAAASPVVTASATPSARSAVKTFNNCDGGDPQGWAILCSDMSGQWIEAGFNDEAGADRFAEHYCAYDSDTAASVGLLVWADRSIWDNVEERSGAHVVIVWEDSGEELAAYISFEEDNKNRPDDETIFYYSTTEEWEQISQGESHSDGWYIQEVKNYTQKVG